MTGCARPTARTTTGSHRSKPSTTPATFPRQPEHQARIDIDRPGGRPRRPRMSRVEAFTTRPELRGTFGMVASTHWLASAAGMAVLERGGNAFDAAVAAGFTLQVVEPHLNGPGGALPVLLYDAKSGEVVVVCGQGTAPQAATIDAFRRRGIDLIPGTGLLPAVVPGAFDGWLLLLERFGTWRLPDVLEFAIGF